MSCLTEERIQQWIDNELDEVARRSAASHVESCADCRQRIDELTAVVRAAERLPRSIDPTRDLWPQIEGRLDRRSHTRRFPLSWQQLAAAAAVLALGVLIGMRLRPQAPEQVAQQSVQRVPVQDQIDDDDYRQLATEVRALRRQVEELVADRGDRFDRPTLAAVNETLMTLQNADREIAQAIEENPDSNHLRAMRASTVKREAHVLADLMVTLNGASMVGIEPTT